MRDTIHAGALGTLLFVASTPIVGGCTADTARSGERHSGSAELSVPSGARGVAEATHVGAETTRVQVGDPRRGGPVVESGLVTSTRRERGGR